MTLRNLPTDEWPFEICELGIVCIKLRDVTQPCRHSQSPAGTALSRFQENRRPMMAFTIR